MDPILRKWWRAFGVPAARQIDGPSTATAEALHAPAASPTLTIGLALDEAGSRPTQEKAPQAAPASTFAHSIMCGISRSRAEIVIAGLHLLTLRPKTFALRLSAFA